MKILVTGGAGFIGSNFIHYLIKNYDDEIINLDKLTYAGNLANLKKIKDRSNYEFVRGDITDNLLVEKIFADGIDYVVNFAAESHVDRSIADPNQFIKTNIEGTEVLLNKSLEYGVKKFVQISTDEVYGSLGNNGYFQENDQLNPTSPYAASKASADMIVSSYFRTFQLPINITRCSNNYGPYQFPEKLIPLFITNALQNKKLPLYGDGLNIRDWIFVKDHCKAIDLVMRKGEKGEVYNIGGNNEKTNFKITEIILEILAKPKSLVKYVSDRLGHDYRYAVDAGKIKRKLGWIPETNFTEGMKKTVDWYLNNKKWWEDIK